MKKQLLSTLKPLLIDLKIFSNIRSRIFQNVHKYKSKLSLHNITKNQMLHPIIRWAQRKEKVFMTLDLRDVINEHIQLTPSSISFKGQTQQQKYSFELQFLHQIDPAASKWQKTGFQIIFVLQKTQKKEPFWSRLTKEKAKSQCIQIDWTKWIDEDEEEQEEKGISGFDSEEMESFIDEGENEQVD